MSFAYSSDHTHPLESPESNSEADRLMAMFFESQCMEKDAEIWYKYSLAHFPDNKLSQTYLREMPALLKKESTEWAMLARLTHSEEYYIFALRCDMSNVTLWHEYNQLLHAQDHLKYNVHP